MRRFTEEEIRHHFSSWNLDADSKTYLEYHIRRFSFLMKEVDGILGKLDPYERSEPIRILDIGTGFQTEIIRASFPGTIVNTLGFRDGRFPPRPHDRHFEYDLNSAQDRDQWPVLDPHDLIVFAEVIEHLYTAPSLVLGLIKSWLGPGGFLVLQTPNACALHKRLKMAMGRNPFEMIRVSRENPGHFREYSLQELLEIASEVGFSPRSYTQRNYFSGSGILHKIFNTGSRFLPGSLRQGITMSLMNPV